MTLQELKRIDADYRVRNPGIFQALPPDPPATSQQLDDVEHILGVRLPPAYRALLCELGGGTLGFATIFSAHPDSDWYLPRQQQKAARYLPPGLVAFSDDFAGGYYVFRVVDGEARDAVLYWDHEGRAVEPTEFPDILEFVARYAYRPA
jgi:hypothetical protein